MEIAETVVTCASLICEGSNLIHKQDKSSESNLKSKKETGLNELKQVVELEKNGKQTHNIAVSTDNLTTWLYEAESLLEKLPLTVTDQSSLDLPTKLMGKCKMLINPDKINKCYKSGEKILRDFQDCYKSNNFQRSDIMDKHTDIRCFAYFALFSATHQFTMEYLVHLWIGEGFIKQSAGQRKSLKQIEEEYICRQDLQYWLILQPSGTLYSIRQDRPTLSASRTCLQLGQGEFNEMTHHLSFSCQDHFNKDSWSAVRKKKKKNKKIRTLLSLCNEHNNAGGDFLEVPPDFCNTVPCLRVLSLKGLNIEMIPHRIENLNHLRYFDISFTPVKILTKEFHQLQALMFLKLKGSKVSKWQDNFYKLTSLIYVDWDESTLRTLGMPYRIGRLSKLESLPLFIVGTKEGYLISELKEMNKLQGTLKIMDLQLVESYEEATKAMLKNKRDLTTIILEWNSNSNGSAENVLRGLELHKNVKELKLIKYDGENFPDWIKDSCLEKIHLKKCRSLDSFWELGKLKKLKTLILENMESKPELSCCSSGDTQAADPLFPALESLELYDLTQLQKITGLRTGDMPYIHKFKATGCTAIADLFFAPDSEDFAPQPIIKSIFENKGWGHNLEIKIDDVKWNNGTITQFVNQVLFIQPCKPSNRVMKHFQNFLLHLKFWGSPLTF